MTIVVDPTAVVVMLGELALLIVASPVFSAKIVSVWVAVPIVDNVDTPTNIDVVVDELVCCVGAGVFAAVVTGVEHDIATLRTHTQSIGAVEQSCFWVSIPVMCSRGARAYLTRQFASFACCNWLIWNV